MSGESDTVSHICWIDDTLCEECGGYMQSVYAMQDRLMNTHNDPLDSYWEVD